MGSKAKLTRGYDFRVGRTCALLAGLVGAIAIRWSAEAFAGVSQH